jgi:DNA polymerase-3 subunit alpha
MEGLINITTTFSYYKSCIIMRELIEKVKNSCKYIAFNDNNLVSLHQNVKECLQSNIKPIIGLTFTVEYNEFKFQVTSYVLNDKGFSNILKINYFGDNPILFESLIDINDGLLFIIDFNELYNKLNHNDAETTRVIKIFKQSLNNFNLGFALNTKYYHVDCIHYLEKNIRELGINIYPFHYFCYLDAGDKELYTLIRTLKSHQKVSIKNDYNILSIPTLNDFYSKYKFLTDIDNIAKQVTFNYPVIKYNIPIYPNELNLSSNDYLKKVALEGLESRLKNKFVYKKEDYINRLNSELQVILDCGFSDYFLVVYDLLKYCRANSILYGPGRGSCVSSLVSYALKITSIDPIQYELIFERFLTKDRVGMPDIDIDICSDRRGDAINYLINRYGSANIASLSVFEHMTLDANSKDIYNFYSINETRIGVISTMIKSNKIDISDTEALTIKNVNDSLSKLYKSYKTHPSGIIIADKSLFKYIPTTYVSQVNQIQYEESTTKSFGLLKLDLLSSNFLTSIKKMDILIKEKERDFDLFSISLNDDKTFLNFQTKSDDIFQLSSEISQNLLKTSPISRFIDLAIIMSLIRPGASKYIDLFVKNKSNPSSIKYLHDDLKPILQSTYGVLLFQEQVMTIASKIAGYTLREADLLRKYISDKDSTKFLKEKEIFISRGINNGYDKEMLESLFENLLLFGSYGFNKSHAVAYSYLSYLQMYIKTHYPLEYYTSLLNNDHDKIKTILGDLYLNKITLLKPSINESHLQYKIENQSIRMPLSSINGISNDLSSEIIKERERWKFISLSDFRQRTGVNESEFVMLVHGYALDEFGLNHNTLIENQAMFFGTTFMTDSINRLEFDNNQLSINERNCFGVNIFCNPFIEYKKFLDLHPNVIKISEYVKKSKNEKEVTLVIGFVSNSREITDKKGNKMAFLTITDNITDLTITMFSTEYSIFVNEDTKTPFVFSIEYSKYQDKDSYRVIKLLKISR